MVEEKTRDSEIYRSGNSEFDSKREESQRLYPLLRKMREQYESRTSQKNYPQEGRK